MKFYASFEERGYRLEAKLPSSSEDPMEWELTAYKDGSVVKELRIPLLYPPVFGPDVEDIAELEAKTDELMKQLP